MEMTDYEIWACKDPEKLQRLAYEQEKAHSRTAEELVRARLFAAQKRPVLTVKASIAYYIAVKAKIGHMPTYWEEFRNVMKLMKSENFNLPYLLVRVNRLFQHFPDLLKGFEMYVPPSYVHVLYSESLRKRLEDAIGKIQPPGGGGGGGDEGKESESSAELGKKAEVQQQPARSETETSRDTGEVAVALKLQDLLESDAVKCSRSASLRDESLSSIAKHGTLRGLNFFENVKRALVYREVYDNFCKCLNLFVKNVLTRQELVQSATPFLGKFPELLKELKDLLNIPESGEYIEEVPHDIVNLKTIEPDLAMEIDYCCGRRECASYRAIPSSSSGSQDKSPSRTPLCKEVINDVWVSFPTWSEESTCLPSLKTEYEETMYRIEDEQFELDMAVQTNAYGIQLLESLQKRMAKMSEEDRGRFMLDDTLGGNSPVLAYRCLNRIYGDKTKDLVEGLKRNPFVAVPIVLNRLRVREKEWKEHQKSYNTMWKSQVKNIHPRSLDVKGMNFRQVDGKHLRVKTLINEIETLFEEKKQKILEGSVGRFPGPHMVIRLRDQSAFKDACDFLSQHTKRQTGIHKDDKREIEGLFSNFILEIFGIDIGVPSNNDPPTKKNLRSSSSTSKESSDKDLEPSEDDKNRECDSGQNSHSRGRGRTSAKQPMKTQLPYFLFFVNNSWYIFFRLFFVLINRLAILRKHSDKLEKSAKNKGCSSSADSQSKYLMILSKIKLLLMNKIDPYTFEEEARNMFGTEAYVSYTFDKLIPQIIKQMHQLINDDVSQECIELCIKHIGDVNLYEILCPYVLKKLEESYKRRAMGMVEDENCYRVIWYTSEQVLTIELLDYDKEPLNDPVVAAKYSDYFDNYMDPDSKDTEIEIRLPFLNRNLVKMKKFWWSRPKQGKYTEYCEDSDENNVGTPKRQKVSESHVVKETKKAEKPYDDASTSRCKEAVKDGNVKKHKFDKRKKKFDRKMQSAGGANNQKFRRNKKRASLKRPRSSKTQQPAKKERKDALAECSKHEISDKSINNSSNRPIDDDDDENKNVESQIAKISQLALKSDDDDDGRGDSGKLTPAADDEEEDSIEISADHLLFHLQETGMSICERYSESFGSQSHGLVENLTEDQCRSGDSASGINSGGDSILTAGDKDKVAPKVEKTGLPDENVKTNKVSPEDTGKIDSVCIAPAEQEVASLVEVSSSEQESTQTAKAAPDKPRTAAAPIPSPVGDGQAKREKAAAGGERIVGSGEPYSEDLCYDLACENVILHENTVAEIRRDSYKVVFAVGFGDLVYRRKALVNARKSHARFSRKATRKFGAFHKLWLDRYVTPNMLKSCHLWMIRSDPDKYQVNCVTINNSKKPPYGPYTKYFIRYVKRKKYCR